MTEGFNDSTIDALAKRLREPEWLTALRRCALAQHAALPWPQASDGIGRHTDVSLLDPGRGFAPVVPQLMEAVSLSTAQFAQLTQPLGHETLLVRANGAWLTEQMPHGIIVSDFTDAARRTPDSLRQAIEADGLSAAEQKLSSLNLAFHHDDVAIQVPSGFSASEPIRLVHLFSVAAAQALFPLTVITVGAGSTLTLIDEYVSLGALGEARPHLANVRIELVLEPGATVHYVRLQRWDRHAREFALQRATLGRGASLTMANINLGAALSKAHMVTTLAGEGASTKLYGFVFGHEQQHIDQHTLQHHQAARTTSDLQFKAALQDQSRMIYTGLIRIGRDAKHTEAFQANHNLLLSQRARAESIPMLEILADDVQCKHASSTGPIDDEQAFYLMSRGIPRLHAERLIVLGFIESIVRQVPFQPLQERLREEIEGSLHHEPIMCQGAPEDHG